MSESATLEWHMNKLNHNIITKSDDFRFHKSLTKQSIVQKVSRRKICSVILIEGRLLPSQVYDKNGSCNLQRNCFVTASLRFVSLCIRSNILCYFILTLSWFRTNKSYYVMLWTQWKSFQYLCDSLWLDLRARTHDMPQYKRTR